MFEIEAKRGPAGVGVGGKSGEGGIIDILFSLRGSLWKNFGPGLENSVCPGSRLRCPSLSGPLLKTLGWPVENLVRPVLKILDRGRAP
jgi:hypothetical protein